MKKKIAILGSTGSIGKTLFNILLKEKKNSELLLLTAHKSHKILLKQAKALNVKNLILTNKRDYDILKEKTKNSNIRVFNNFNKLDKIFKKKIDYVMSSISGINSVLFFLSCIWIRFHPQIIVSLFAIAIFFVNLIILIVGSSPFIPEIELIT